MSSNLRNLCNRFRVYKYMLIIISYWLIGVFAISTVVLFPRWKEGYISFWFILTYYLISASVIICFYRANRCDPGYVTSVSMEYYLSKFKKKDMPDKELCAKCQKLRPERSHHCSTCNKCVLLMDHHCPWINNCVGENNCWIFNLLLVYSIAMSVMATVALHRHTNLPACRQDICSPQVWYFGEHYHWWVVLFLKVLCYTMICAAGFLSLVQHLNIYYDVTTVELIQIYRLYRQTGERQTLDRKVVLPTYYRFERVYGYSSPLNWFNPLRSRRDHLIDKEIIELSSYMV